MDNAELISQLLDAVGAADTEGGAAAARRSTWELVTAPDGPVQTGGPADRATFLGQVAGLRQIFPDGVRYEIAGITDGGDRVAVEASAHADVHGMSLHNRYHFLFEISDGTVIRAREYLDLAYLAQFHVQLTEAIVRG